MVTLLYTLIFENMPLKNSFHLQKSNIQQMCVTVRAVKEESMRAFGIVTGETRRADVI